jgi:hypothetical protein
LKACPTGIPSTTEITPYNTPYKVGKWSRLSSPAEACGRPSHWRKIETRLSLPFGFPFVFGDRWSNAQLVQAPGCR